MSGQSLVNARVRLLLVTCKAFFFAVLEDFKKGHRLTIASSFTAPVCRGVPRRNSRTHSTDGMRQLYGTREP